MMAPQSRLNAAAIRADRRASALRLGHIVAAVLLACATVLIAHVALQTVLALPEIVARSASRAAW